MSQIGNIFFNLNSPISRVTFSAALGANPPHKDFNLYQQLGLIQPADPNGNFTAAIGTFELKSTAKHTIYISTPKRGEPAIGDKTPLRQKGDERPRPYDTVASVDFTTPAEPTGTNFQNAIAQAPVYIDIMDRLREYLQNFDFEEITTHASGLRGISDQYEVFVTQQTTGRDVSTLPDAFKKISETNSISNPIRHLLGWQSVNQFGNTINDASYTGSTTVPNWIDFLADVRHYLNSRSRAVDGIGLKPAMVNLPSELSDKKAVDRQMNQYTMLVSDTIGNQIVKTSAWKEHQGDLIQAYGLKQGITTGLLGMFHNIVLVSSPLMPRFNFGGSNYSRAMIFGQQAMAVANYRYNIPIRYRARKEGGMMRSANLKSNFQCWMKERNEGKEAVLYCEGNRGIKKIVFQKPVWAKGASGNASSDPKNPFGTNPQKIEAGLVNIDLKE